MKRLELIANQSVLEDTIRTLESEVEDFRYTVVPTVLGRGRDDWKWATTVWPESNFLLISYQDDETTHRIVELLDGIKERFPREGLTVWTCPADPTH